jgi:signal transduction histidine kinase
VKALVETFPGGWPLAVVLAAALAQERRTAARRSDSLRRAVHELRRPLHALGLVAARAVDGRAGRLMMLGIPSQLDRVKRALADVEGAIDGRSPHCVPRPVAARRLLEAAAERWHATARSREIRVRPGHQVAAMADPARISQALDNLIANALEHGEGAVVLGVDRRRDTAMLTVEDSGAPLGERSRHRDPRRGHGLRVVADIAAAHRGRFALRHSASGTCAALELPLAGPRAPAA